MSSANCTSPLTGGGIFIGTDFTQLFQGSKQAIPVDKKILSGTKRNEKDQKNAQHDHDKRGGGVLKLC